jgi:hypothetical protein
MWWVLRVSFEQIREYDLPIPSKLSTKKFAIFRKVSTSEKMTEKLLHLVFPIIIAGVFALNFNDRWTNQNYETLKSQSFVWFWFRLFNVDVSRQNFARFIKWLSAFVIFLQIISLILVLVNL